MTGAALIMPLKCSLVLTFIVDPDSIPVYDLVRSQKDWMGPNLERKT